jgi:hypothetical protein
MTYLTGTTSPKGVTVIVVDEGYLMEIPTLPTLSRDSARLAELHGEWLQLRAAPGLAADTRREIVGDLARRVVEHRSVLFAENASLHAERDIEDREVLARLDANQDAIKFCTVILGEIAAALGMTSLPKPQ